MSRLYFDATNVLSWGPQPPVGITRVEATIVREALAAGHEAVLLDRATGRPRTLGEDEAEYLAVLVGGTLVKPKAELQRLPPRERLRAVAAVIDRAGGLGGRELARYYAEVLVGATHRRGLAYHGAKQLVRSYGAMAAARARARGGSRSTRPVLDDPEARVLWSNGAISRLDRMTAGARARSYAFLHDVLPISRPECFEPRLVARFTGEVRWMMANCAGLLCPSETTRREAARLYPGQAGKLHACLPAGLLRERVVGATPERPALPPSIRPAFALYCATIEPRKNHITALKVWRRLSEQLGGRCPSLVIVGRWGWLYGEVEAEMRRAQADGVPIVHLSGLDDLELIWLYQHATFGIYPSLAEGFGLGVAECLDFGVPVIISEAPSLAEAAQGSMPIVPALDVERWVEVIAGLVTSEGAHKALKAKVLELYHPQPARAFFHEIETAMRA